MSNISFPSSYPYKPKKWLGVVCIVLFGFGAWFLGYQAQTHDNGINLIVYRHILEIPLSAQEATLLLWGITILSAVMSLLGFLVLYKAFISKAELVLANDRIIVPVGVFNFNKTQTILYAEIHSAQIFKINGNRFLRLIHENGKLDVSGSMLPAKSVLDDIYFAIENKCSKHLETPLPHTE